MQLTRYSLLAFLILVVIVPALAVAVVLSGNVQMQQTLSITGSISKGSGTFVIDHPLDPKNKLLYHSFVESPDVKNIYDGIARLDTNGEVSVTLPEYFKALNKEYRYQLFALYEPMPDLYVKKEVEQNVFIIGGGEPNGMVSWQVTGIRNDPYIQANPIVVEVPKGPGELVRKGQYLIPEAYEN